MKDSIRHFFVCTNRRAEAVPTPGCGATGSVGVADGLRVARQAHGLLARVYITETQCLGPCPAVGATVVVYPEAVWYTGVKPDDVAEIVAEHMLAGRPVERLRNRQFEGRPA